MIIFVCPVCIQNQSLTQRLHCNACYMEHFDHKNLSLCVLSRFSAFSFYCLCRHFFKQLWLNLIPNLSLFKHPPLFLIDIERHCIDRIFIVLWHTITKYIFRCLDEQWYQRPINLITYNITTNLSIIAWCLIRYHHLVYIIVNISVICLCSLKSLVVTSSWPNFNIFFY